MLLETPGGYPDGKDEKCSVCSEFFVEPLDQKIVFTVEHGLETDPTDVAVGWSVDCVAERHVIGGHGLGDGARGSAHLEKTAGHFLPGTNLGKSAVLFCVEVDLERLPVRSDVHLGIHLSSTCGHLAGSQPLRRL